MTDLHAAAAAAGLQRDWVDAEGRAHRVGDDTLAALLATLDTSPPTISFVSGVIGRPLAVAFPPGPATLILEDGREQSVTLGEDLTIDTIGYHELRTPTATIRLAIAPPRCPAPPPGRGWGVAVQIPALQGASPAAYGDYATLADAAAAFGRAGADSLAISPTHALFPADPTRFSPYAPSSRLFHNVLLASPGAFPPEPAPELIDWPQAIPARLAHLRQVYAALDDATRTAVATWRAEQGPGLEAHARFDALHAHLGGCGWLDWPTAYHDPASPAVATFAAAHADEVGFYAWLQWLAGQGLAAAQTAAREHMRIGLIADLAVGMDPGGSHGWSRRDELLTGVSIGAPPDPLGPTGQDWGITALDPFALAHHGFRPFAETLRASLRHGGGLRIDHALGLQRLWIIPGGGTAGDGAYLTMPCHDLLRIVAIEAHRAQALIVGEDLGTVPPGFRATLRDHGMLGMRVLPFERDRQGGFTPSMDWGPDTVAMTGTHDTPTLAGWWRGLDLDWREALGDEVDRAARDADRQRLLQAVGGSSIDATLAFVADAPSPLMIVPAEDLAGIVEQPNLPGTIDEHPNWRRRLPSTDALLARPDVAARTALLTAKRPAA